MRNPLNRQWFFRSFHKKLAGSLGKDTADQIWDAAGEEFGRILDSQPELKRHKGALTLPAVALYRVLSARGEDAEGLLNSYGENMGRRFARIIHSLTSLPGADRLVWRHVGSVMEKPAAKGWAIKGRLCLSLPTCTGWIFSLVRIMNLQRNWARKRLSCASATWTGSIPRVFGIFAMTATRRFRKGIEPANTGFGLIPAKIEEITVTALEDTIEELDIDPVFEPHYEALLGSFRPKRWKLWKSIPSSPTEPIWTGPSSYPFPEQTASFFKKKPSLAGWDFMDSMKEIPEFSKV